MDSDPAVVLVEKVEEDEISTDKDSGMESAGNSKDDTPERKTATVRIDRNFPFDCGRRARNMIIRSIEERLLYV